MNAKDMDIMQPSMCAFSWDNGRLFDQCLKFMALQVLSPPGRLFKTQELWTDVLDAHWNKPSSSVLSIYGGLLGRAAISFLW